jgi:hypothetical protein
VCLTLFDKGYDEKAVILITMSNNLIMGLLLYISTIIFLNQKFLDFREIRFQFLSFIRFQKWKEMTV